MVPSHCHFFLSFWRIRTPLIMLLLWLYHDVICWPELCKKCQCCIFVAWSFLKLITSNRSWFNYTTPWTRWMHFVTIIFRICPREDSPLTHCILVCFLIQGLLLSSWNSVNADGAVFRNTFLLSFTVFSTNLGAIKKIHWCNSSLAFSSWNTTRIFLCDLHCQRFSLSARNAI